MPDDTSKPKREPWNRKHKAPLRPDQQGRGDISLSQERLIGRVIVEWSKLEQCIQDLIWRFLNLTFEDGRILTERTDITRLITVARALARRKLQDPELTGLLDALTRADELRDDRNFIVHGTWCTVDPEGIAFSASLRQKSLPGEVTAEEFPHARMHRIVAEIIRVKSIIVKVYDVLPYPYDDKRPLSDRGDSGAPPTRPTTRSPK